MSNLQQLGSNFSLPFNYNKRTSLWIEKDVEDNIRNYGGNQIKVRNIVDNQLQQYLVKRNQKIR